MICSEEFHLVDYSGRCVRCGASRQEINQEMMVNKAVESNNKLAEAIEKLIRYLDSH